MKVPTITIDYSIKKFNKKGTIENKGCYKKGMVVPHL
jgi:hypothetical protein